MKKRSFISDAVEALCKGKPYILREYENSWELEVLGDSIKPTNEEIEIKAKELEKEWINTEYQRKRALEYPPVTDYLDAVVKGDLEQQQQYIDACLAVKAKYPKPGV